VVTDSADRIGMKETTDGQDLEQASLEELVEFARNTLVSSRVLQRAAKSALYRARWQRAGFNPEGIKDLNDLRRAPLTAESDLVRACHPSPIKSYACSDVQMWFRVTGRGGATWWMPCGKQDIMRMLGLCRRMSLVVGISDSDLALVLSQPAPTVSDSLPYFLGYAHRLQSGARMEIVPLSLMLLLHRPAWADFFLKRQPTILVATPTDALQLADILRKNMGGQSQTGSSTTSPTAGEATSTSQTRKAERRGPLERLRLALLFGSGTSQDIQRVAQEYGVETFQMQGATDCLLLNVECQMHKGVHIWLDTCIAEILPVGETEERRTGANLQSQAVFLHEAKTDTRGELVVTTFGEALPLVRYRTGETVEVVSNERCRCGLSHPRVRFL
jgi:phenylacetate-CoA ligase